MMLVFEQAGSLFTGWIRSCWACLTPKEKGQNVEGCGNRGVEREMQVCHTQPQLVPPMKLVVYDDLPTPSIQRQHRNSLSSWISEGKNLASRASVRPSVSHRRHSTTPLRIGAPTDFRRVQSFQPPPSLPAKYQPLELSIHRPDSRLSDLPSFESFQLDKDRQRGTLAVPPRSLSTKTVRAHHCASSEPAMLVSRKPVGSGNHRSLRNPQRLADPAQPVRIASALIPHFSIVNPPETALLEQEFQPAPVNVRSRSEKSKLVPSINPSGHAENGETQTIMQPRTALHISSETQTTQTELLQKSPSSNDSPSSASSRTMPSRISSLRRPSTAENRKTIASAPLPNRMSQWFTKGPSSPKQVSLAGEKKLAWERTRTLSGTTVASTITAITGATNPTKARNHNDSISSTITNITTPRTSFHGPQLTTEKDLEAEFGQSTIYEGRPQHRSHSSPHCEDHAIALAC